MIHARFSFGYIGASIVSALNIVVFMGFLILNVILGGQTLASASNGSLSWDVGIVIIAIISLFVSFRKPITPGSGLINCFLQVTFCGYKVRP